MPEVFALNVQFRPTGSTSTEQLVAAALQEWLRRRPGHESLPILQPYGGWARRVGEGGIVRWEVYRDPRNGSGLLELTWRHPHNEVSPYLPTPDSPELQWSSRVSCILEPTGGATLLVRISNNGPAINSRGVLSTTRPRFLIDLATRGTLRTAGDALGLEPKQLRSVEIKDLVRFELFDPARRRPVLLVSPRADGSFVVPPTRLAAEFLSLASVYVVETPQDTFALTDALGRRDLSAFHGALRVYLPGLQADSNPLMHPLLTARSVGDGLARHRLASYLALRTVERFVDDPRVAVLRDQRAAFEDAQRHDIEKALEESTKVAREAGDYQGLAELYARENASLSEQNGSLKARLEEALSAAARLEDDKRRLQFALEQRGGPQSLIEPAPEPDLPPPSSVREAVEQSAELFSEQLKLLPDAFTSAEDSPFERPEQVLETLKILADLAAGRAQPGGLGKPFSIACKERGLDYRPTISKGTPKKLKKQYEKRDEDGTLFLCDEHIAIGTSYDPKVTLRLYFTTKAPSEDRIVIGHVGRHAETVTTT